MRFRNASKRFQLVIFADNLIYIYIKIQVNDFKYFDSLEVENLLTTEIKMNEIKCCKQVAEVIGKMVVLVL